MIVLLPEVLLCSESAFSVCVSLLLFNGFPRRVREWRTAKD